ncbi:hypothetical protein PYCCODRAFT_1375939, partial [Trametes coccinea BRFM310]
HYDAKVRVARQVAGATIALDSYIGQVPPLIALQLYRARVEPHLTAGCEVALDISPRSIDDLAAVQHTCLRRALQLSAHAQLVPLFSETGLWPLRYRRYHLALRYLLYILREQPALPHAALRHAWCLSVRSAAPSWWSDLFHVGNALPAPCALPLKDWPTVETVEVVLLELEASLQYDISTQITRSRRLPLLQARLRNASRHGPLTMTALCTSRAYLGLPSPRQRNALIRLVASAHPLAVEQLRHPPRAVTRADRLCRFCRIPEAIEDESHALLECPSALLMSLRASFIRACAAAHPGIPRLHFRMPSSAFLDLLFETDRLLPIFAEYVADVFDLCHTTPLS